MIYEKLSRARVMLLSANIKKSGVNSYSGYTYFELSDFLPESLRILNDLKVASVYDFSESFGEQGVAKLRFVDTEDLSEVTFSAPYGKAALKGCHDIQNKGAEQTYLRRYLWVQAMEIIEHDAIDKVTDTGSGKKYNQSVAKNDFDSLSNADKSIVLDLANNILDAFSVSDKDAFNEYKRAKEDIKKFENNIQLSTGLWSQLDSKQRSTIKRLAIEEKEKQA